MVGLSTPRLSLLDGTALQATPIPAVMDMAGMANDLAADSGNDNNNAPSYDEVQQNLFTTGTGKTIGQQRESNQIAELSPELVQAGTNMAKIVEEKEEAKKRTEEAVRDMIEEQQEVLSQQALDNMEWTGDKNEVWTFGGKQGTRESWYKAAKAARAKLPETAKENGWNDEKLSREDKLLAEFMRAQKEGDQKKAAEIYAQMDPKTQQAIDRNNGERAMQSSQSAPVAATAQKSAVAVGAENSITAGDDYILRMSNAGAQPAAKAAEAEVVATAGSADSGLAKNPPMQLSSTFSVATAGKATQAVEAQQLASAEVEAPAGKLTGLSGGFSIPQRNA